MVREDTVKLFDVLFPFAVWLLQPAADGILPKVIKLEGPHRCGQMELIKQLTHGIDPLPLSGASFAVRTDRVVEEVTAKTPVPLLINMVQKTEDIVVSVLDCFSDRLVFLAFAYQSGFTAVTVNIRPLTLAETRDALKLLAGLFTRWSVDKELTEHIFEFTQGYQDAILEFLMVTEKFRAKSQVMEAMQGRVKYGTELYASLVDKNKSLDTVLADLRGAISGYSSRAPWRELASYIKRTLAADMLAGDSSFVMSGAHELLCIDLESSEPHFIAGFLEIAKVIRQ